MLPMPVNDRQKKTTNGLFQTAAFVMKAIGNLFQNFTAGFIISFVLL
jgi:hypothetical protein